MEERFDVFINRKSRDNTHAVLVFGLRKYK